MIILTGGAGFIGSCMLARLNELGITDVLVVDHLTAAKGLNLKGKRYKSYMDKAAFLKHVRADDLPPASALVHLGACSSTTETSASYLEQNNTQYSIEVVEWALKRGMRVIYASSAATYGDGKQGYSDDPSKISLLRPLNLYGLSKQRFDEWATKYGLLDRALGFKFFNVYGPNEAHKGEMRSLIDKAFGQILETGALKLFKYGEQDRDFIYIKDVVEVLCYALKHPELNGLYNLGSGEARTWNDLARAIFKAMGLKPNIQYIPMPSKLKGKYQYHTQADMKRFFKDIKKFKFTALERGVADYIQNYLIPGRTW